MVQNLIQLRKFHFVAGGKAHIGVIDLLVRNTDADAPHFHALQLFVDHFIKGDSGKVALAPLQFEKSDPPRHIQRSDRHFVDNHLYVAARGKGRKISNCKTSRQRKGEGGA